LPKEKPVKNPNILALDLGTSCGYAWGRPGQTPVFGALDLRPGRFSGAGMRFVRFARELQDLMHGVDLVGFEEVRRHRGVDAAHVYGGLMAVLTQKCEEMGIPYEGYTVGSIKKHATGRGNASKEEMVVAAIAKGHHVRNDDEADALAIWYMMKDQFRDG
jgi:crossover junction endodeoxyribonuclease RuvC